jgi:hypothetical protein
MSRGWGINELVKFQKRQAKAGGADKGAIMECTAGNEPIREDAFPAWVRGEYTLRYSIIRSRLLDDEDLATKHITDALHRAKIEGKEDFLFIPGDAPWQLTVIQRQRKCRKGEQDHIIIDTWKTSEGPPPDDP